MAVRGVRIAATALLLVASLGVTACSPPPALTKEQLDAKKTPKDHPKIGEAQRKNCRGCHREAPAIRK